MDAKAQLQQVLVLVGSEFSPEQHVIHKPKKSGSGVALKLQLRMNPKWVVTEDGSGFFDKQANKDGGLFIELAAQNPGLTNGNATFDWKGDSLIRAKLGMADICGLLSAIREWRLAQHDVPAYLQAKNNGQPNQVSLFHKFENGSTVITYTFEDQQSILRVSKGKDKARSIAVTLGEEMIFERYLQMAMDAYLRVGKR